MNRPALLELVEKIAEPLVPIVYKAIDGLLRGQRPEDVLTHAEREALAEAADAEIDRAFGVPHKPNTGV
jgi:hypothetical protein